MSKAASDVVIVDSTLTVEFLNHQNIRAIPMKKVRLPKFANAYWQLETMYTAGNNQNYYNSFSNIIATDTDTFYFHVDIVDFPVELKKNCFTEFSVTFNNDKEPKIKHKQPFQSTYRSDSIVVHSTVTSFTANLLITKKTPICPVETSRKSLLVGISGMYEEEALSDFTFVVNEKEFKVHKSILAASSPVMLKLFTADYKEKDTNKCKIADIEPGIFEALIRFMYRCELPENLTDVAHELYAAAHYYEVENLKEICLNEIHSKLSKKTAMMSYALAFKYDLKKLSNDAWSIIKSNILISCPSKVKPMPPDEIVKILEIRKEKEDEEAAVFNKYLN